MHTPATIQPGLPPVQQDGLLQGQYQLVGKEQIGSFPEHAMNVPPDELLDELPLEEGHAVVPVTVTSELQILPLLPWHNLTGIPIWKLELNPESGTVTGPLSEQKTLFVCTITLEELFRCAQVEKFLL